ncbi:MAG: hypothetical protein HC872_07670 [Gammaproteobacteria bacterium]|nr:hypothetical protein [Gammaproteobacteria bacterium]
MSTMIARANPYLAMLGVGWLVVLQAGQPLLLQRARSQPERAQHVRLLARIVCGEHFPGEGVDAVGERVDEFERGDFVHDCSLSEPCK